jgi:S-adenosylmethionine:tRNA ribosyltransferase-isomerase
MSACVVDFELPPELEADRPPEARGVPRDRVRLLVDEDDRPLRHAHFDRLPALLRPGDLLVVNNSATLPAALPGMRPSWEPVRLHLSQRLAHDRWTVELRRPTPTGHRPLRSAYAGETVGLPDGANAELLRGGPRLWEARLTVPGGDVLAYLDAHGEPIRYGYVGRSWPLASYQTVFATEPGSAEMPSAGRAFTPELVTALVAHGIGVAPITLHTGVSSPEEHEPPYAERFSVPGTTARLVNETGAAGGRVIAVGTTVVRALETAADAAGRVHPLAGWTDLVVTPERGVRAVDGLLTGLHEPRASHLRMLEAVADCGRLNRAYTAALAGRYLWHEFGDLHLILPAARASAAWPARRAA